MSLDIRTSTPALESKQLTSDEYFRNRLKARHLRGRVWRGFFLMSVVVALLALLALFLNVINSAFGYVIVTYEVDPESIAIANGRSLDSLSAEELSLIIVEYQARRAPVYIRDELSAVADDVFTTAPMSEVLVGRTYPPEAAALTIRELSPEQLVSVMSANINSTRLLEIIDEDITKLNVERTYSLWESLTNRAAIETEFHTNYEAGELIFKSWLDARFLTIPRSTDAFYSGIRTAILGTLWVIAITVLFAFPIGVGAAIYLEEYAKGPDVSGTKGGSWFSRLIAGDRLNRLIETNIRNLAGVPSIIYGLLGLAIFVRVLEGLTQGRTVLSAGLTMGLLVLPVVIINAQEAIRAVPSSIREASYGMGATKWQTIWQQVLPAAIPGILTGTILALSRAIGETAPLIVIGASTYIAFDPSTPFSRFTALPIQIYNMTADARPEYKALAGATIVVLLVILLLMNSTAIVLRQRFRKKLSA